MIDAYVSAVVHTLSALLDHCVRLALPAAILGGIAAICVCVVAVQRGGWDTQGWRSWIRAAGAWLAVSLLALCGWAVLRQVLPVAQDDVEWRESKEATSNPVPDAPPVEQYGPSLAALVERTYSRTLTLPPDFVQRLGNDGLGVIAPYMTDPTAENVLRLVDTFKRSGKDVVFTREATRRDEEPMPLLRSAVSVKFRRLSGSAYEAQFEGRYLFRNSQAAPITARLVFPLPPAGTVRDVSVIVGGDSVAEPNPSGAYEWKSAMAPGEQREAVAKYRVIGARSWRYDMGSQRRRVEQFRLDIVPGGAVKFRRGSLQPSTTSPSALRWDLANVVTAQQIQIEIPPDTVGTQCTLQALSALPAAFALFLLGIAAAYRLEARAPRAGEVAVAILLSAAGFAAAPVVSNYIGPIVATIVAPLAGCLLAARVIGGRAWLAAAAALIPAAFLSPHHSGLILLALAIAAAATAARLSRQAGHRFRGGQIPVAGG